MLSRKRIYWLGAFTLLITAIFSKGYYHFDEHFQILEFAGLKLDITPLNAMPWEYTYKIRPTLQPVLVIALFRLYALLAVPDPFVLATITRILSAILSFLGIVIFIRTFLPQVTRTRLKQAMLWLSFFLWFLVYNDVRFSSENWSGNIFLIAICLSLSASYRNISRVFIVGALMGISFIIRFQSAFLIIGFVTWLVFIKKENYIRLIYLGISIITVIGIGVFIDHWYYGEWTLTCWNYFYQNIVMHRSADFGVAPWWFYFRQVTLNAIPPFSLIYPAAFLLFFFFYPKHILTFILIPFLLVHFVVSHKELRFIFPVEYYFPFMLVMVSEAVLNVGRVPIGVMKILKVFICGFWITNIALLIIVMFNPANGQINFYEKLYYGYPKATVLYYTGDEPPYGRWPAIYFYRRANLEIKHINSTSEIQEAAGKTILFADNHSGNIEVNNSNWQLVFRSLPAWLLKYDPNKWQERAEIWYIYEWKGLQSH